MENLSSGGNTRLGIDRNLLQELENMLLENKALRGQEYSTAGAKLKVKSEPEGIKNINSLQPTDMHNHSCRNPPVLK